MIKSLGKHLVYILIIMTIWQIIYWIVGDSLQWPSVQEVAVTTIDLFVGGHTKFFDALKGSLTILLQGVSLAILVILSVTLLTLAHRHIKGFVSYLCSLLGPVPSFAWLPIFLILVGYGRATLYSMCVFGTMWWAIQHLMGALDTAKKTWNEQTENLKFNIFQSAFLVYIPALLPTVMSTIKVTFNHAFRMMFAIETTFGLLGGGISMGALMSDYRGQFMTTELYAMVFVIMCVGLSINFLLDYFKNKLSYYKD